MFFFAATADFFFFVVVVVAGSGVSFVAEFAANFFICGRNSNWARTSLGKTRLSTMSFLCLASTPGNILRKKA